MRICRRCLVSKKETAFRSKTDLCTYCREGASIEARRERRRTPYTHDWWMHRFTKMKASAKRRNIEYSLTFEELKELDSRKNCFYCNIEFGPRGGHMDSITLDRVDNALGYIYRNIVAACRSCNCKKGSFAMDSEMARKIIEKMYPNVIFGDRAT